MLNSRQKELLRTFLENTNPLSYQYLSDYFKLSTRTIQREIKSLKATLKDFDLTISRTVGSGIELQGADTDITHLKNQLEEAQVMSAYAPEERQEGITYDLLLAKEPLKQEYFSTKYGVSIATIANDLDKVNVWLEEENVIIDRSPGIGIFIDVSEQKRRALLSRLLHKDITFEDWLELFHEKREEGDLFGKLNFVVRSRLLKFVQTDKILSVDQVLSDILDEQKEISLNDRNYVNLMIHILLAMERIESGRVIEDTNLNQWEPFDPETLSVAKRIVTRLGRVLSLTFPEIEIKYIALHLAGAKATKGTELPDDTKEEFLWIELTQSFIRSIEHHLGESFEGDQLLFEGLVSHFVPVFNRLKYNLQIHNPMLDKIKNRYPKVFEACQKACAILTEKTGYIIPEDEIGYLAMHIGASLLRVEEGMRNNFKAIVVCASGLGTSMYLSTKIRTQIPNVQVEAVVSMNELANLLATDPPIDIIISTVNLPVVTNKEMVVVSSFLKSDDVAKIKNALVNTTHSYDKRAFVRNKEQDKMETSSLKSLAIYGEGMMQIIKNFKLYQDVKVSSDIISNVLKLIKGVKAITNLNTLKHDLREREKLGGFALGGLAMLHTKSEGVTSPLVSIFRTDQPIPWYGDNKERHLVQTIILLVVPIDAPVEHMEVTSEIPASFINDEFVHILLTGTEDKVKTELENILTNAFKSRITTSIKGIEER